MTLTPELRQKVSTALDAVEPLEGDSRAEALRSLWRTDPEVAAAVESLLQREGTPGAVTLDSSAERLREGVRNLTPPPHRCDPAADDLPRVIGPYEIQGQIGKGGMGVVWRARDGVFRRSLAVKVLAARHQGNPDMKRRFLEEAQLMGQLQHPGIPPVHDLGKLPDGRPYFVMKLIRGRCEDGDGDGKGVGKGHREKGQTLEDLLAGRAGPDQDRPRLLAVFGQVCETLAYAHARGIIHRDLKPSNIMVGAFGEVQVMDWGLAKVLANPEEPEAAGTSTICTVRTEAPESVTQAGQAMGTPAYMAPEQARGETARLDERCDVFGLGAILCEILTGQPPYVSPGVLRQAQRADLAGAEARLAACGADTELVALARRCLAPRAEDRPANAGGVAAAVVAYHATAQERLRQAELEQRAAEVRAQEHLRQAELERQAAEERAAGERKRWRLTLRLGAVIAALLVALTAGAWWWDRTAGEMRVEHERQADSHRAESEARKQRARQRAEALFDQADQALAASKGADARRLFADIDRLLEEADAPELRDRLAGRRKDLALVEELENLFGRRWRVVQETVFEQTVGGPIPGALADKPGQAVARSFFRPEASPGVLRREYAALFRRHGLAVLKAPAAEVVGRVQRSPIRAVLTHGLVQWFLLDRQSRRLGEILDALEPQGRELRLRFGSQKPKAPPAEADLRQIPIPKEGPATRVIYLAELLPDGQAIDLLKRAVETRPGDYHLLAITVNRLLLHQPPQTAAALGYARAAQALRPGDYQATLLLWLALRANGHRDEAVRVAERLVERDPHSAVNRVLLGAALVGRGYPDRAIPHLEKAVQLDGKNAWAHYHLGEVHNQRKDYAAARRYFLRAIELDRGHAPAHRGLAYGYRQQNDYDRAIPHLKAATELDPGNAWTHWTLGDAYRRKGDFSAALAHLNKAVRLAPRDGWPHYYLGCVAEAKGDYAGAVGHFTEAIRLDRKDEWSYRELAYAHLKTGDLKAAVRRLEEAIQLNPKHAWSHLTLGLAHNRLSNYDAALVSLRKAAELDPRNAEVYHYLGWAHLGKKEYKTAVPLLEKAIGLGLEGTWVRYRLGHCSRLTKDWDKAIVHFTEVVRLDPRDAWAHAHLGEAYNEKRRFDEALRHLLPALKLEPRNAYIHANLGRAYHEKREFVNSSAYLTRALELGHRDPWTHYRLGIAHMERRDSARAIAQFTRAIHLDPKDPWPYAHLGSLYRRLGNLDGAVVNLGKAIELGLKQAWVYDQLGGAYTMQGQPNRGVMYSEEAVRLDPKSASANTTLGWSLTERQEYPRGIAYLKKALELDPNSFWARNNLGRSYHEIGEYALAVTHLQKAVALRPDNPTALTNLGEAYYRRGGKGDREAAVRHLARAVELGPEQPRAYFLLGYIHNLSGDYDRALPYHKKAIGLGPRSSMSRQDLAGTYNNLGVAYSGKKDYDAAIPYLLKAIALDPRQLNAHANLGRAYFSTKRFDEAANYLKKATQLKPDAEEAHNGLLLALTAARRLREAVAAVGAARRFVPVNSWARLRYNAACAFALAGCGRGDAAKLAPAERARLREQARLWLRDDLKACAELARRPEAAPRKQAAARLKLFLADDDLAPVRDAKALAALSAEERKHWEQFWGDVRKVLEQAGRPPAPPQALPAG
jgi:tetratricopeptide (TPR) repeat protein/serine/threonine protein kinase